ncbi:hypothetical protein [Thetidibacter halocola]|uniref:Uncharacterized protein n=1 Tax=Thetidibacter halocola TaxID=2827239 RepID=A0A8J7WD51_9RHOB|nr:hypothetical protein [Thetidibacter halocola]MBS0123501.1 hypothetical protein [Thetidibacter halocola]
MSDRSISILGLVLALFAAIFAGGALYFAWKADQSVQGAVKIEFLDFDVTGHERCCVNFQWRFQATNYSVYDRFLTSASFDSGQYDIVSEVFLSDDVRNVLSQNYFGESASRIVVPGRGSITLYANAPLQLGMLSQKNKMYPLDSSGNNSDPFWAGVEASEAVKHAWKENFEERLAKYVENYDPEFDSIIIQAIRGCRSNLRLFPSQCGRLSVELDDGSLVNSDEILVGFFPNYLSMPPQSAVERFGDQPEIK